MDDEWESAFWTDATRDALKAAAETAIAALRTHIALLEQALPEQTRSAVELLVEASGREVREAFTAVSDAEFDYSASFGPFSLIHTGASDGDDDDGEDDDDDDDDGEDDDEEAPLDASTPHHQLSIMVRRDYRVTSLAEVLDSGRAAYLRCWPDDTEDDARSDVDSMGRALYQNIHAGGLDSLNDMSGLEPANALLIVVSRDELMTVDDLDVAIEHPGPLFTIDGDVLYSESGVWRA